MGFLIIRDFLKAFITIWVSTNKLLLQLRFTGKGVLKLGFQMHICVCFCCLSLFLLNHISIVEICMKHAQGFKQAARLC